MELVICDHCGKEKECTLDIDPFTKEGIEYDYEKSWWCEDCYDERAMDI